MRPSAAARRRRTARAARRRDLRTEVFARDQGRCIWPGCDAPATEMMHFTSIGGGGRVSADTLDNAGAGCYDHARMTDGLPPDGPDGQARYREAIRSLTGEEPGPGTAWHVAEILREYLVTSTKGP